VGDYGCTCSPSHPKDRNNSLSFEYAAFVFSVRRPLDYLAVCIGAYFKAQSHSARRVAKVIDDLPPVTARKKVQRRLRTGKLVRLIGDPSNRSVRDEMAHYRAIESGIYNVRWDSIAGRLEIVLAGGGERFEFSRKSR
jgi:hypothetical protein